MYPLIVINSEFQISTFYLVLSLVVCLCLFWLSKRAARLGYDRKLTLDAALVVMIASFVGSRLFHIFYENPEVYRANPIAAFYIWNGGFVFYGGALLAGLCGFLFVRMKAPKIWPQYFDLFAPVCSLAYALGRWGCFFAGCCYGKYCQLAWAIQNRHPTQLYASFWEIGTLCLLLAYEKKMQRQPGHVFLLWIVLHSVGRLLMESTRADFRGASTLGLSVSSWISLVLLVVAGSDLLTPYLKMIYQNKNQNKNQ